MVLPKITFVFSSVYDEHFRDFIRLKFPQFFDAYPSREEIDCHIEKVEKVWREIGEDVLSEMTFASNMSWDTELIPCYVVGNCVPFSDPLTIKVYKNPDRFIDTLVHELIHQLFTQKCNHHKMRSFYERIEGDHGAEATKTRIHIPVHALHTHLYLKLFTREKLDKDIETSSQNIEYKRAWEIVNADGYENIIKILNDI